MPEPSTSAQRGQVRLLVFSGSLREGSFNTKLATLAGRILADHGATVDAATMDDFSCSSYDQDQQSGDGPPDEADDFRNRIEANDGFVISSPEYNASLPGSLKNAIDWVSRHRPQPFNGKHGLLLSASPSMVGGNRGLWALRVPLEHLGSRIYPDMFSLAQAHQAFDANGGIANAQLAQRLEQLLVGFLDLVEAAKHYPAAKKAWVEFLGERVSPEFDRVE